VRSRNAALESAEIALKEAGRHLAASKSAYDVGALPGADYHAARVGALKAEQDQRAAKTALEASEAELEHYSVTAPIDGVIAWLKVNPGTVARPGTAVWGEVIDLSEIGVECSLTPEQAERVAVDQKAEVSPDGRPGVWSGEVILSVWSRTRKPAGCRFGCK
jgi:multidrug resistance efflux pump